MVSFSFKLFGLAAMMHVPLVGASQVFCCYTEGEVLRNRKLSAVSGSPPNKDGRKLEWTGPSGVIDPSIIDGPGFEPYDCSKCYHYVPYEDEEVSVEDCYDGIGFEIEDDDFDANGFCEEPIPYYTPPGFTQLYCCDPCLGQEGFPITPDQDRKLLVEGECGAFIPSRKLSEGQDNLRVPRERRLPEICVGDVERRKLFTGQDNLGATGRAKHQDHRSLFVPECYHDFPTGTVYPPIEPFDCGQCYSVDQQFIDAFGQNGGLFRKLESTERRLEIGILIDICYYLTGFPGFVLHDGEDPDALCEADTEYAAMPTCEEMVCMNGGFCVPDPYGDYCHCSFPYYGQYCEMEQDDYCDEVDPMCQNGGTCVPYEYRCDGCDAGWGGYYCDVYDPCNPNPCQNEGECFYLSDPFEPVPTEDYYCICPRGFSGEHCEDGEGDPDPITRFNLNCIYVAVYPGANLQEIADALGVAATEGLRDLLEAFFDVELSDPLRRKLQSLGFTIADSVISSYQPVMCPASALPGSACYEFTIAFVIEVEQANYDAQQVADHIQDYLDGGGLMEIQNSGALPPGLTLLQGFTYIVKKTGGAFDDPHFQEWNGDFYDFMGACDLHLLMAPHFAPDLPLVVDIRTKIRYEYSFIESAVLQIGANVLEVGSWGEYWLDGVADAQGKDGKLPELAGFPIEHTVESEKLHKFEIHLGKGETIQIKTFKDMVSVKIDNANVTRFRDSVGMMGEFGGEGRLLGRDGATVIADPNAFAAEWQVRSDEPMLFQTVGEVQHPQPCKLPEVTKTEEQRKLGEQSISYEDAKEACIKGHAANLQGCIHDVIATGDIDLAAATF